MDFSLSEEQEMFRGYVRKYLDGAGQTKIARDYSDNNTEPLHETIKGLSGLGCTSINISEKYGGLGLGTLDLVPVLEETGRALLPGVYLETMALAVPLIERYGTEDQKLKYLLDIAEGIKTVTLAWLESEKDYQPEEVECLAHIEGDSLIINGVKSLVPDGDIADVFLVLVRTNEGKHGEGLSLILIDKSDDFQITIQKSIDETRHLATITFQEFNVSKQQVLGEINHGWAVLQEGLLYLNAALSSIMVGGMEKLVEICTEYAKIREQFGQPIGRFQAIKHKIVDMKLDLELARSLSYYANWVVERGEEDREAAIYSARTFATEAYIRSASHSIQIHGGIGFTMELDCHLYLKRARFYENYVGTLNQYHEKTAMALNW